MRHARTCRSPARGPRDAHVAAFTMLEVLVTLAIMALVMVALYSTLNATLRARDQLEIEARVARLGPQLLDLIEEDLSRIWLMDIQDDRVFHGESRLIDGDSADSLAFLTTVDSTLVRRIGEREATSDISETGYRLRRNPNLPDVRELWRRQQFHVDEEPLADGNYELLYDRVVSFRVRYLERLEHRIEPLEEWDASVRHALPAAVIVELALEAVPRTEALTSAAAGRVLHYRRVIPLEAESDLRLRVHALPPTFATAGSGGPGGGAGGDGDEDDDGDGDPATNPDGSPNLDGSGFPPGTGDPGGSFQDFLDDILSGVGGGG